MSKFAKFCGQLHTRSLTSWIFAAVLIDRSWSLNVAHYVDAFNKITECISASVSCWKFTHHLNSTVTLL